MPFTLRGARLVDAITDIPVGDITIDGTHIRAVGAQIIAPSMAIGRVTGGSANTRSSSLTAFGRPTQRDYWLSPGHFAGGPERPRQLFASHS